MEPMYVEKMDLDEQDPDPTPDFENILEISENLHSEINNLHKGIIFFKNNLYNQIIKNNEAQNPLATEAMYTFHALYLQSLAFLIGLLDNKPVPVPTLPENLEDEFEQIRKKVEVLLHSDPDANILLYNLFFKLQTQHPFQLNMSR
jgi:hypothetical protein